MVKTPTIKRNVLGFSIAIKSPAKPVINILEMKTFPTFTWIEPPFFLRILRLPDRSPILPNKM
jgi:hypothetical protein